MNKIDLKEKFSMVTDHWSPKIVAELNGQHVKIAKIKGEFEWHHHENEDELFWIIRGEMKMHLRDETIALSPGQIFVVPKGVEHKPEAIGEVELLMFEPAGTLNTGNVDSERTVESPEFI